MALLEASIQEKEDPPVHVQQLQMAESRPMFMPCTFLSKETTRASEAEANQDAQMDFGVNYYDPEPENMEDADNIDKARVGQLQYLHPCQMGQVQYFGPIRVEDEGQGFGAVTSEKVLLDLKPESKPEPGPAELVIFDRIDNEEIPSVEVEIVSNEDAIEATTAEDEKAPIIINRPREPEVATTMTLNAKTSKSPGPASTKTSKTPKTGTMAVEVEAIAEKAEFSEALEDLTSLEKDYEEVGTATAESEEDEEEDGN